MSTKFYTGQKDYISKLNELDDIFTLAAASPEVIVAAEKSAILARDASALSASASTKQATNASISSLASSSSAVSATLQASIASTQAGNAAGSASQVLAIYGTTNAMQTALNTAAAQSQLAQTAASSASSVLQQDLSAVSTALHRSPNPVTAMFLYDTSKDSDGGAWTERMQHTSWYNEALNGAWRGALASEAACRAISGAATSDYFQATTDSRFYKLNAGSGITEVFRGNTAKFPRLAMIVAEASNVTIYDLTQPGRPMWMRFFGGYNFALYVSSVGSAQGLTALNGELILSCGANSGISRISFIKDFCSLVYGDGTYTRLSLNVAGRHSVSEFRNRGGTAIVNNNTNAVAMTVLTDAPFDVATGIQIPTIVLATNGGVSVIKHDGTVVNITGSNWGVSSHSVKIYGSTLYAMQGFYYWYAVSLIGLNSSVNNDRVPPSGGSSVLPTGTNAINFSSIGGVSKSVLGSVVNVNANGKEWILAFTKHNSAFSDKGATALITSVYNTGFLVGDIRRAYLCNTEVESVSNPATVLDRSYKAAGATIMGTLIKSLVA